MEYSNKIYNFFLEVQILLVFLTAIFAAPSPQDPEKCLVSTILDGNLQVKWDKAHEKCGGEAEVKNAALNYPKMTSSIDEFEMDDKCFNQCVYKEMEIVDGDKPKKDVVAAAFKGNMTAEMTTKMGVIWNTCVDDCDKIIKKKGAKSCMIYPMHMWCVQKKLVEEKVYNKC